MSSSIDIIMILDSTRFIALGQNPLVWFLLDMSSQDRSQQVMSGHVQLGQFKSRHVKLGQVKSGQVKLGQVKSGQFKAGQVKSGHVKWGEVKLRAIKSEHVKLRQVKSGLEFFGPKLFRTNFCWHQIWTKHFLDNNFWTHSLAKLVSPSVALLAKLVSWY